MASSPSPPGPVGRWRPRPGLATVVSLVLGAGYFAVSRGFQNFYPFSVVDMYAGRPDGDPSRILAVDASGRAREVSAYVGWRCDGPISEAQVSCAALPGRAMTIGYVDRDVLAHITAHPAPPSSSAVEGEPVRVVRRVWQLGAGEGPPPHVDCPMASCRAVRR